MCLWMERRIRVFSFPISHLLPFNTKEFCTAVLKGISKSHTLYIIYRSTICCFSNIKVEERKSQFCSNFSTLLPCIFSPLLLLSFLTSFYKPHSSSVGRVQIIVSHSTLPRNVNCHVEAIPITMQASTETQIMAVKFTSIEPLTKAKLEWDSIQTPELCEGYGGQNRYCQQCHHQKHARVIVENIQNGEKVSLWYNHTIPTCKRPHCVSYKTCKYGKGLHNVELANSVQDIQGK